MPLTPDEREELDDLLALDVLGSSELRRRRVEAVVGPSGELFASGEFDLAGALQRAREGKELTPEECIVVNLGFLPEELPEAFAAVEAEVAAAKPAVKPSPAPAPEPAREDLAPASPEPPAAPRRLRDLARKIFSSTASGKMSGPHGWMG